MVKILIVDDDKLNLQLANDLLRSQNGFCDILLCDKPELVLELLETEPIGVIILDIVMPVMDGISLLRQIRSQKKHSDIQIIMFSGISDIDSVRSCFEIGANDYINKPINSKIGRASCRERVSDPV